MHPSGAMGHFAKRSPSSWSVHATHHSGLFGLVGTPNEAGALKYSIGAPIRAWGKHKIEQQKMVVGPFFSRIIQVGGLVKDRYEHVD